MEQKEKWLNREQAARLLPGNPSPEAVWRFMRVGIKARDGRTILLGHVRSGGRLFTTQAALEQFNRELTEADLAHFHPENQLPPRERNRSDARRQRDLSASRDRLKRARIT